MIAHESASVADFELNNGKSQFFKEMSADVFIFSAKRIIACRSGEAVRILLYSFPCIEILGAYKIALQHDGFFNPLLVHKRKDGFRSHFVFTEFRGKHLKGASVRIFYKSAADTAEFSPCAESVQTLTEMNVCVYYFHYYPPCQ